MAGIYLHVPLCRQKCAYCDFYSVVALKSTEDFVDAICNEINLQRTYLKDEEIQTIYFGGGTPSVLQEKNLEKIINELQSNFKISKNPEITFEANPDDLNKEYLTAIYELGINRLSIGIQSIDDSMLQVMKRKHTAEQAIKCVELAQNTGFKSLSIDLIYGLPDLTLKNWERNINEIVKLNIQHISAYYLTIEPNTLFYKLNANKKLNLPDEKESVNQFELLIEKMEENGFLHYEISNFAKDGFISLHNTNYWMNVRYLGLGPSAHSYNLTSRQWNIRNLPAYMSSISKGELAFEHEILSEKDKYNDYIITSLRTIWGLNIEKVNNQFGKIFMDHLLGKMKKSYDNGFISKKGNIIGLTKKGIFIADHIIESFLFM